MKARVKATGEIVEVRIDYKQDADYIAQNGQLYWQRELDFNVKNKDPGYWEKLLHQYAGMAMQGILAANATFTADDTAKWSIEYATALVEKLKNE